MRMRGQIVWGGIGLVWVGVAAFAGADAAADESAGLRMAISESIAGEVNANDLRFAIKAWSAAVEQNTGVKIVPLVCNTAQLMQLVTNRQVDGFSVNIIEYARLAAYATSELVIDESEAPDGQEYVLLVHQDADIHNVSDLRGRTLLLYQNPRMCLNRVWLDVMLASAHAGPADTFLGRIESNPKLTRVVLPVFFRQADACLVTKHAFATMCELNPQLARQLRTLATSPRVLTTLMTFHKDSPVERRRKFLAAIMGLHKTAAGQQALMLFGSTRLALIDNTGLRSTLDLLHGYARLGVRQAAGK